ncbi:hypothetical protein BCR33DRAFT_357903 [Rhizoclosmatium globosum]|uniref:CAP-Gly domain-containing protein n=1 Tax=Rhizoclosmatium globosum TaxID=329046 RepID=A0A1Y2C149_9FUNG|nr:hypothetical protein BCR33DRAFT_357903 [Rhizoclosmatium globosum]|eukprot:ORY40741.1 hypothetical protein BCR33DRAFT_357903 [Rhizoclosmatium globosum]
MNQTKQKKVYYSLFPTGKEITFEEYLSKLSEWKLYTLEDRIKFLFKVLDYDQDGVLTPPDISIFISQLTHHKYALSDRVRVRADGRLGTVRHIGETKFAAGVWVGIELDQPVGKHNGTVQGVKYFTCENLRGLFVPYANVELVEHVKIAEEICEQLSGFVGVGGGSGGGGGSDALGYEKFRDALVADSCYRSELDTVQVGL